MSLLAVLCIKSVPFKKKKKERRHFAERLSKHSLCRCPQTLCLSFSIQVHICFFFLFLLPQLWPCWALQLYCNHWSFIVSPLISFTERDSRCFLPLPTNWSSCPCSLWLFTAPQYCSHIHGSHCKEEAPVRGNLQPKSARSGRSSAGDGQCPKGATWRAVNIGTTLTRRCTCEVCFDLDLLPALAAADPLLSQFP